MNETMSEGNGSTICKGCSQTMLPAINSKASIAECFQGTVSILFSIYMLELW